MIIVIKEHGVVHLFRTRGFNNYLYRDLNDLNHPDNQSIKVIGDNALLAINEKQRFLDYIEPHIRKDEALSFDKFIDLDYKQIKKALKEEGLLKPSDMKSKVYDTEAFVYAKDGEFVVVEGFENVLPSTGLYVSSNVTKMLSYLNFHKDLDPKNRGIQTLLDDMEYVYFNYFPLEYVNTKDQVVEIITLKEALCQ
jgi:hypothetical protein